jgi:hypothetical protein
MQQSDCVNPDGKHYPHLPISTLGAASREHVESLLLRGEQDEKSPFRDADAGLSIFLRPGEMQQVFVRLVPKDTKTQAAYAVQIDHWVSTKKDEYIGGLTAL